MKYKYDVILLTEDRYEQPEKITPYISNVLKEDNLVKNALQKNGLRVGRVSWSNPTFDWSSTRVALFRTTWDYFYQFNEFEQWLSRVSNLTQLIHSPEVIKWNLNKVYLKELEEKGIRIPETTILNIGDGRSLRQHFDSCGFDKVVLKPCVSGCARHTYVITAENVLDYEQVYRELIEKEQLIIQPFQKKILTRGEVAHMVIGGRYSHSILKLAKPGEFRVQDDFGGTTSNYKANVEEINFVEQAIVACKYKSIYGRVDVVWDNNNQLAVSEIEMIEPEMWFRYYPEAADKLAQEIFKEVDF